MSMLLEGTKEQMRERVHEARDRGRKAAAALQSATTAAEYSAAARAVRHAARDHEVWRQSLQSLERL